uniref:RING-type domain-containing protein n=1 Tax=Strigamia maritima TaxID=126957 RepID=T1IV29_STRMM
MAGGISHNHGENDLLPTVSGDIDISKLTDEERWRYEHHQMHEKHRGHDSMHVLMIFIFFTTLFIAQFAVIEWKKRHFKSYQSVSLVGMWLIPLIISVINGWFRFGIIWVVYTILTGIVMRKAMQKPISGTTPRLVYKWFYLLYKISYALGIFGHIMMMLTLLGLNHVFNAKSSTWMDVGLLSLFYGLYYGVLSRDIAEISTDKMAAHVGYYTTSGMPVRRLEPYVCAVCGNEILVKNNDAAVVEKTYKLTCNHTFHEFCIRGWCIVGKKQTCPYCKEKVDLKRMFCNPWERPHMFYGQLLDWIRYLVVWQPLIITVVQGINWLLGLE